MSIRPVATNPSAAFAMPVNPHLEDTLESELLRIQKSVEKDPGNEMVYKKAAGLLNKYLEKHPDEKHPNARHLNGLYRVLPASLLAIAATCGFDPFLEWLLAIPEDKRPRTERISEPFHHLRSEATKRSPEFVGETALHRAVGSGCLSTVKLLVRHGSNLAWIGSRDAKDSCFRIAVARKYWDICEYIFEELPSMNFYEERAQTYVQLLTNRAPCSIVEKFLDRSLVCSEKDVKKFSQELVVNTMDWERWDLFSAILDKIPEAQLRYFFGDHFFKKDVGRYVRALFENADKALIKKFVSTLSRAGILPWNMVLENLKAQNLECIEGILEVFRRDFPVEKQLQKQKSIGFHLHAEHEIDQWIASSVFDGTVFRQSIEFFLNSLRTSKNSLDYQKYVFTKLQYFILAANEKRSDVRHYLVDVCVLLFQYSSLTISSKLLETQVTFPALNAVRCSVPGGRDKVVFEVLKEMDPEFYLQFQSEELINWVIDQHLPKDSAAIFSVFEKALEKKNMAFVSALVKKDLCTGEHPYLLRAISQGFDPELILALIEKEISLDVKEDGSLPLHQLCQEGTQYPLAFAILKKRPQQFLIPNNQKRTPLHFAAMHFSEVNLKSCMDLVEVKNADLIASEENIRSVFFGLVRKGYSTCLPKEISEAEWIELAKTMERHPYNLLEEMFTALSERIRERAPIEGYRVIASRLMGEGKIYLRCEKARVQRIYKNSITPTICQLLKMSALDSELVLQCLQSNTDLCFSGAIIQAVFLRKEEQLIQFTLDILRDYNILPRILALHLRSDWAPFKPVIERCLERYKPSWIGPNQEGKVPLQEAIEAGNGYFIEFYLQHFGYPQLPLAKGTRSPLLYAVKMNQLQSVQALKNLLVSKNPESFRVKDSQSKNILHLAASLPQKEILSELLNTLDRSILEPLLQEKEVLAVSDTPLLTCFKNQLLKGVVDWNTIRKFKELGADFSVINDEGESPLHWMLPLNLSLIEIDVIKDEVFAAVQKFHLFASMPLGILMTHLSWMNKTGGLRQEVAQRVALKKHRENAMEWHRLTRQQNGDQKWSVKNQLETIIQMTNFCTKYKSCNAVINQANHCYGLTLLRGHLDFIGNLEKTIPDVSGIQIEKLLDLFDEMVDATTSLPTRQRMDPFGNSLPPETWTKEQLRNNLAQLIQRITQETHYTGTPPANTASLKVFYQIKRKILRQFIHFLNLPAKEGDDRYSRNDNIRAQLIDLSVAADVCATRTLEELRNRRNEMLLLANKDLTPKELLHLELFTLRQQLFLEETRKITSVQGSQNVHNQYKVVRALGVEFGVISPDEITDDPTTEPLSEQEIRPIRERMQSLYNPLKLLLENKFYGRKETVLAQMIGPKEESELETGLTEYTLLYDTADVLRAFEEGGVIERTRPIPIVPPPVEVELLAALYAYILKPDNQEEIEFLMSRVVPQGVGLSYLEGLTMDKVLALTPATLVEQLRRVEPPAKKRRAEEGRQESVTLADLEAEQRRRLKGKQKAEESPQSPKAAKKYIVMKDITGSSAAAEVFQGRLSDGARAAEELAPLEGRVATSIDGLRGVDRLGRPVFLPPNEPEDED